MAGKMDCHGLTDRGRRRLTNEDQFLIADLHKALRVHQTSLDLNDEEVMFGASQGMLLLVADGLGGHSDGEHASRIVVEGLADALLNAIPWFFSPQSDTDHDVQAALERALQRCQAQLQADAASDSTSKLMASTLTAAYINWPRMTVIHAGDSRCYLFRTSKLRQVTRDHTIAEQMMETGSQSAVSPSSRWAQMLWNAIGSGDDAVQPEVHQFDLALGDALLLCTDGLTREVAVAVMEDVLNRQGTARESCHWLVDLANERGGADNITVVLARFLDQEHQTASAAAQVEKLLEQSSALSDTVPETPIIVEESTAPEVPSAPVPVPLVPERR